MPAPRPQPQERVERDGTISIDWIKNVRLRIEYDVRSQPKLPVMVLHDITHSTERVCANAKRRVSCGLRKQFIFVYQLQPRVGIIALAEVQGRLQQVAILHRVIQQLAFSSPNERRRPVAVCQRSIVFERSAFATFVARIECLRTLQVAVTVFRYPIARRRGTHSKRPRIQRAKLNVQAVFIWFVTIEGTWWLSGAAGFSEADSR